jgi:hypothetical protein
LLTANRLVEVECVSPTLGYISEMQTMDPTALCV